jgi:hypothetical protein
MYVWIYACMCVSVYACACMCVPVDVCMHSYFVCLRMYVCERILCLQTQSTHECLDLCMHVCVYGCLYACIHCVSVDVCMQASCMPPNILRTSMSRSMHTYVCACMQCVSVDACMPASCMCVCGCMYAGIMHVCPCLYACAYVPCLKCKVLSLIFHGCMYVFCECMYVIVYVHYRRMLYFCSLQKHGWFFLKWKLCHCNRYRSEEDQICTKECSCVRC